MVASEAGDVGCVPSREELQTLRIISTDNLLKYPLELTSLLW